MAVDSVRTESESDWRYLLRDIYNLYRFNSAGVSSQIRSHQKEVRLRLSRLRHQVHAINQGPPSEKFVCKHLSRALDMGQSNSMAPRVRASERIRHQLFWEFGYLKVPPGLSNKFAFSEFTSPKGPIISEGLILGIVLFAPLGQPTRHIAIKALLSPMSV